MKNFKNYIIIALLLTFIILILYFNKTVLDTIYFSFEIWIKNIFPSLFPMFVVTKILINYNFVDILGKFLSPIMKLFKTNPNCSFILAASMISGFPSSAYFTNTLLEDNKISNNDASKILLYSHFSNPLFILGTVNSLLNTNLGILVLLNHYLSNFIIAFIFRNYHKHTTIINKSNKKELNNVNFSQALSESIISSINTLLLILGTISITLVLTNIITEIIPINKVYIASVLEMTQGIKYLSLTNISIKLKLIFTTMIISFGGLSIFLQIKGVLNKHPINFKLFILVRIIHAIISGLLTYLMLQFF